MASQLNSAGSPVDNLAERSRGDQSAQVKEGDALSVSSERFSKTKKMSKTEGGPNKLMKTEGGISDKM
ncbi:MAG: hypothetical protein ACLQVG_32835 [Terriglobia bacterium]